MTTVNKVTDYKKFVTDVNTCWTQQREKLLKFKCSHRHGNQAAHQGNKYLGSNIYNECVDKRSWRTHCDVTSTSDLLQRGVEHGECYLQLITFPQVQSAHKKLYDLSRSLKTLFLLTSNILPPKSPTWSYHFTFPKIFRYLFISSIRTACPAHLTAFGSKHKYLKWGVHK